MDISVITTTYNAEQFITQCILSVAHQATNDKFSYEHVIVDDGSKDKTKSIIKSYQKIYKNIIYIDEGKVGRAKALNIAIEKSRGDLIAILDADDLFHPKKLLYQWEFFEKYNEVDLLSTDSEIFKDEVVFNNVTNIKHSIIEEDLLKRNIINHSSVVYKKKTFVAVGKYNESRSMQIDLDLWCRFLINQKVMYKMNEKLFAKRLHENQNFENKKRLKYIVSSLRVKKDYILKMKKYNFLPYIYIKLCFDLLPRRVRTFIKGHVGYN